MIGSKRIWIGLSVSDTILGLTIGHTESRNRYDTIHQGEYMSISGVRPSDWGRFLRFKNIPMNSLRGGVAVFKYYMQECGGNMTCASQKYKGIQSSKNMKLAYQLVDTYNKIMALEKQRDPEAFGLNGKKPTTKLGLTPTVNKVKIKNKKGKK